MKLIELRSNLAGRISAYTFLLIIILLLSSAIYSAPADPDFNFGIGGTVLTELDNPASVQVVLIQPDNKIIAAGSLSYPGSPGNYDFAVVRYRSDGTLDPTFGSNGKVITPILLRDTVRTGALQPDGKILIGGTASGKFALVRYNSDGSLDPTFGAGGKVLTDFITSEAEMRSILLQPDGKIIAVGDSETFYTYLCRYNADGTLDSTFGSGGKVTTNYANQVVHGKSALLQPDGKIVVGGESWSADSSSNSTLLRYKTDGTLDESFDGDGVATFSLSDSHDRIKTILFRPDGKILSIGTAVNAEENAADYAVGVFNSDGTPDFAFGDNGFKIVPAGGRIEISKALVQPDGKIVVAGTKTDLGGSHPRFHLVRFNENGSFDLTFGNGGRVNLPIGYYSWAYCVAIQPDKKLVVAGSGMNLGSNKSSFALNRLQGGSGQIPATASVSGRVINDFAARGVGGVPVVLSGGSLNSPRYTQTNPFGFYRFADLPVGAEYTVTVVSKKTASYTSLLRILLNGNENADDLIHRLSGIIR